MQTNLTVVCDAAPLMLFTELLETALKVRQRPVSLGNLPFELARVENDVSPACTGELRVRLYPSDAFLRFASTLRARNFELSAVEQTHNASAV